METKDFALLMLIPAIFIGIVAYAGFKPDKIGRAKEPLQFDIIKSGEPKVIAEPLELTLNKESFVDFTNQEFCPKGKKCTLKEEAYLLYVKAFNIAKQRGKELEFVSGYKSLQEQTDLWEGKTPEQYAQRYKGVDERSKYVCDPRNGALGCPHLTGFAVDVTFKGKKPYELSRAEQRELDTIMAGAGWVRGNVNTPNIEHPWHFECCGTGSLEAAGKEVSS